MISPTSDRLFAGSIPEVYENYLVPLIFEPYAADLASRVVLYQPSRVLEIAAGTGVVTRHLARVMPKEASIVATDLNRPMLDQAVAIQAARPIEWLQADAMQLPFPDATFDVVVCQFGVMFFPDKVKAFSEAWRVLRWGGHFLFNVWDRIEENEFADTVTRALAALFPKNPPQFLARIPHGYADVAVVAAELGRGGFSRHPTFTRLAARSRAASPAVPAIAYCQGTPLRSELEARGPSSLDDATAAATTAIRSRFGEGAVDGKIRAYIVIVER